MTNYTDCTCYPLELADINNSMLLYLQLVLAYHTLFLIIFSSKKDKQSTNCIKLEKFHFFIYLLLTKSMLSLTSEENELTVM